MVSNVLTTVTAPARAAVACKLCGEPAEHLCRTANATGTVRQLDHFRCRGCGLVFIGTPLSGDDLADAYAAVDMDRYYREIATRTVEKYATSLSDLRRAGLTETSRILDVGTGDASFLAYLREAGFQQLTGQEIPGDTADQAEAAGFTIYRDFGCESIPANSFDAATLLDVFEHVPDPLEFARGIARTLRPDGLFYCHTPAVTCLDRWMHRAQRLPVARKIATTWQSGRTSIFHLQNYTRGALELVLREAGFVDVRVQFVNELSWPVGTYVRVYLCEHRGLPRPLGWLLTPLLFPVLRSSLLNGNKAIVTARKPA